MSIVKPYQQSVMQLIGFSKHILWDDGGTRLNAFFIYAFCGPYNHSEFFCFVVFFLFGWFFLSIANEKDEVLVFIKLLYANKKFSAAEPFFISCWNWKAIPWNFQWKPQEHNDPCSKCTPTSSVFGFPATLLKRQSISYRRKSIPRWLKDCYAEESMGVFLREGAKKGRIKIWS